MSVSVRGCVCVAVETQLARPHGHPRRSYRGAVCVSCVFVGVWLCVCARASVRVMCVFVPGTVANVLAKLSELLLLKMYGENQTGQSKIQQVSFGLSGLISFIHSNSKNLERLAKTVATVDNPYIELSARPPKASNRHEKSRYLVAKLGRP